MVSPDDIASLKVKVQKLAVALEEFSLKLAAQGMVNNSKLPCYTSNYVVGDTIKLTESRICTAHVSNNEVEGSPSISVSNASNGKPDAQHVFDKLSEPILSRNIDQVAVIGVDHSVLNDIDEPQPGVNGVPEHDGIVPDYVRAANSLFHRTPIPKFILEMAKAAETTHAENEEMVAVHQVFDTMPEPTTQANGCATIVEVAMTSIEDTQNGLNSIANTLLPSAKRVVDELPLPTFIKEMAEPAKIVEFDAIQDDYESASAGQNERFTKKQYLFAKLGASEGSHLRDVVNICANRMRFSTILGSLFNGCQHSGKMPHEVDKHYDRKMNSESECPHIEVSVMSSIVSNAIPPIGLIKNVALPLLWGDLDCFMGSSICKILGMEVFNTSFLEPDCHGYIHSFCFECPLLRLSLSRLNNVLYISSLPNNEAARLINEERLLQLFDSMPLRSKYTTYSILNSHKHDVEPYTTWISIPYDPGILVIDLSTLCFTYTLEDKGDFRGEEDTSRAYTWELFDPLTLCTHFNANRINKNNMFLSYVIDPGDSYLACDLLFNVVSLAFLLDKFLLVVFDDIWTTTLPSCPFSPCSIVASLILALIIPCLTLEDNSDFMCTRICSFIFDPGGNGNSLSNVSGLMNRVFSEGTKVRTTVLKRELGILLEYGARTHSDTIFPFDPGGVDDRLKMIEKPQAPAPKHNGVHSIFVSVVNYDLCSSSILMVVHKRFTELKSSLDFYESRAAYAISATEESLAFVWDTPLKCEIEAPTDSRIIFVFDPGGLSKVYFSSKVTDLSSHQNSCVSHGPCFLALFCEANMILEDKDHFEGSVMIHTENISKGSLVTLRIYCFYFHPLLAIYKPISLLL